MKFLIRKPDLTGFQTVIVLMTYIGNVRLHSDDIDT